MNMQSTDIKDIASALTKAQAAIKPALKDSTNPHFRSKYADLASVWDAARPVLTGNGLSVTQTFANGTGGETVTVVTTLLHTSGQWISSALTLKPAKADPQGIGSAITYGRRYGLSAILGIVADEDDDGNAASGHHEAPQSHAAPAHRPAPQKARSAPQAGGEWRSCPVPKFVKKGQYATVGDLPENDLRWWAANYEPKPWQGKIQEADIEFQKALRAGVAALSATPPGEEDFDPVPASASAEKNETVPF